MKTRLGKIAQLPKSIRDELNRRLENGHQSPELLKWLNGLPKTKKFLAKKFESQPITKSNLSHWRHGGFHDWKMDQAREARIQRITESGTSLEKAEGDDLFENFARMAVAELAVDLDSLQKLRGEKRSQSLHNLIRDLARLQNAFNRSRWAALAWTKYNNSGTGVPPVSSNPAPGSAGVPPASRTNATPSPSTTVAPDRTQSQATTPRDSKPATNPFKIIHHTKCECGEPCPKCHAPDSEYPLDEVLRDKKFYKENGGRNPYDRYGRPKHLMNCDCDCFCDRCAEKNSGTGVPPVRSEPNPNVASALRAEPNPNVASALRAEPAPVAQAFQPAGSGDFPVPSPLTALDPRSDFLRKMSLLKTASR